MDEYVIDKVYKFVDNTLGRTDYQVRLTHDNTLMYANQFLEEEDPSEVDGWLKDALDEYNADVYADNLYRAYLDDRACEDESEDEELTLEDFYEAAWEYIENNIYYYRWPDDLIQDCIEYKKGRE